MSLRRKFSQTKFFRAFVVSIVLLFFLIWQPRFLMEPLRIVLATIAWPIQGALSSVSFSFQDGASFLTSIGRLKQENERLLQENVRLTGENIRWQAVAQENDVLRKELELLPRDRFVLKAAEVIGRDAAGLGNWITIDRGSRQGIESGMAVVVSGKIFVGRVTDVFPESARVMLVSNPESVLSGVTVEGGAQGVVRGEYGLGIVFDMVPQDAVLQFEHHVVTSGLGGDVPKDLILGTLQEVRPSTDYLYRRASITPLVDYDAIRYVFVITKKETP